MGSVISVSYGGSGRTSLAWWEVLCGYGVVEVVVGREYFQGVSLISPQVPSLPRSLVKYGRFKHMFAWIALATRSSQWLNTYPTGSEQYAHLTVEIPAKPHFSCN